MTYAQTESTALQVLTLDEVNQVNGGIAPLVIAYGVGFLAGMAYGAYLAE